MKIGAMVCAAAVAWSTIASPAAADLKVRYYKGEPTFISTKTQGAVQVAMPPTDKGRRVGIVVIALNRGASPQSLGYENVSVRTSAGVPVTLLTYEVLQHKARVQAGWMTFFAAVAAGANSYAAQQSAYGHSYGSAYTSTRYGGVASTYSARYYSPVAAQVGQARANAENRDLFAAVSGQLEATLAKLDGSVLRTTTIDPGESFGGMVVFDLPKGTALRDLVVSVNYAGETHEVPLNGTFATLDQVTAAGSEAGPLPPPEATPAGTALPAGQQPPAVIRPVDAQKTLVPAEQAPVTSRECGMVRQRSGMLKMVPC